MTAVVLCAIWGAVGIFSVMLVGVFVLILIEEYKIHKLTEELKVLQRW